MDPVLSLNDIRNGSLTHAVLLGKFGLCNAVRMIFSNIKHLGHSKPCRAILLTFTTLRHWVVSTLFEHVINVVGWRTSKQMGWVTAWGVVAMMTNVDAICNRAIREDVGETVCACDMRSIPEYSMPITTTATRPRPAFIGAALIYLLPKSFFGGQINPSASMPISKPRLPSWDRAWIYRSATAASAVARWFFVGLLYSLLGVVSNDISAWLPLYRAGFSVVLSSNWRGLAASTFTEFLGSFLCVHRCNYSTFYTCRDWQMAVNLSEAIG